MPDAFLFLQGPTNVLFPEVARLLRDNGHRTFRINFCLGDQLFWPGPGAFAYRGSLREWPGFLRQFCAEKGITHMVLLGEQRELHRAAVSLAHDLGIDVAVTDFGYLRPDWVILERDGMNGNSLFTRDADEILLGAASLPAISRAVLYPHHALNQALWDMAFHLVTALWPFGYPHYRRHTLHHPAWTYLTTGFRLARGGLEHRLARKAIARVSAMGRFYLFAMQMEDDFSLRAYSDFPELDVAMEQVVRSFGANAPANSGLLFKLHPLDPGRKAWRRRIRRMACDAGLVGRVFFIDGGDLDQLLRDCAGLVTVNSTVGLRAIELLRPAMVLGQALYKVPGLTFAGQLDDFWTQATAPRPEMVDAYLRMIGASLHVRGGMYDRKAIRTAASGIAYRLHHGLVNDPIAEVLLGLPLSIQGAAE